MRNQPSGNSQRMLNTLMIALALWGLALAFGAFLFGLDPVEGGITIAPSPLRGAIVLGCMATFLGLWAWLLYRPGRRA